MQPARAKIARNVRAGALRFVLLCLVQTVIVAAAIANDGKLNASITWTSDYFYRGYSKSHNAPSLQANVEYSGNTMGSGYFLGVWIAEVDFTDSFRDDASDFEIVPYFGWNQELSDDFRAELQFSRYIYNDRIFGKGADYYELYLFAHYRDLVSAEFAYGPDAYDIGIDTFNYQLTGRYPVLEHLDVSGGFGFYQVAKLFEYDYWYWNLGTTWHLVHFAIDLRYIGSKEVNEQMPVQSFWTVELPYDPAKLVISISVGF